MEICETIQNQTRNSHDIVTETERNYDCGALDNKIQWIKLGDTEVGDFVAYPAKLPLFNKKVMLSFPNY